MTRVHQAVAQPPSEPPTGSQPLLFQDVNILTGTQLHALFDILTHHQAYYEIERFKFPQTVTDLGYPFADSNGEGTSNPIKSSVPVIAYIFQSVVLSLPLFQGLSPHYWNVKLKGLLTKLGEAELSESYDKGAIGTRKTLATATSAVVESVARGCLGGCPKGHKRDLFQAYNNTDTGELVRAWNDVVHELVHGSLIDQLFEYAIENESLEGHSPAVKTAIDYIIIHMATLIHHVFVLSPEGPYLLKLLENVHKLAPWSMMRQTLRISNAATMMKTMMKLMLAKMSIGGISNWIGLTQDAKDGMNLLQRIISLVLLWDASDFRKTADKLAKARNGPSKAQLAAIRQFMSESRATHELVRHASIENHTSIVVAIFQWSDPNLATSLSAVQHTQCLEYYSALLSVRDRDELTNVFCRTSPDLYTQSLREVMTQIDPIVRTLHVRVDLKDNLSFVEKFLDDLVNVGKPRRDRAAAKDGHGSDPPSVEEYVQLLRDSRSMLYISLHQAASKCPELSDPIREWAKTAIRIFQPLRDARTAIRTEAKFVNGHTTMSNTKDSAAGSISSNLQVLFAALPIENRRAVAGALDAHASYLSTLETLSQRRMQQLIDNLSQTSNQTRPASMCGPGMYILRWQAIIDKTPITSAMPCGPPRCGKDVKYENIKMSMGALKHTWGTRALAEQEEKGAPVPPDVRVVIDALADGFRKLCQDVCSVRMASFDYVDT